MNTTPTLTTHRLTLRPFTLADAKRVQELAGDARIAATTGTIPHPYLDGMAEAWIAKHDEWFQKGVAMTYAITLKESGDVIGCINFSINKTHQRAEVGYWLGVDYWNAGYCTEAMKTLVQYGFTEMGLNKITSRHMSSNPASGRVMIKAGMKHEGTLRKDMFKNGEFLDIEVYGILSEEYQV